MTSAVVFAALWSGVVLWARPPTQLVSEGPIAVATTAPPTEEAQERDDGPTLRVVGSGAFAERALQGQEFAFFSMLENEGRSGAVDVDALESESAVLQLLEANPDGVDVIELGFRLELLSGELDASFVPVDPALVPTLSRLDPALSLTAAGIVPALDGVLTLFAHPEAPARPSGWGDLVDLARAGETVVIPGPPLSLSVVFVWVLGDGDVATGLDRYGALLDAGAVAVSNTSELLDVVIESPAVGAWSSPGVFDIDRGVEADLDLVFPSGGAVPLPAFTAILASSERVDLAHRWLEFRLSDETQQAMTFTDVATGFGERDPVPWVPVIDSGHPPNRVIGFDPAEVELRPVDWASIADSVDDVTSALVQMVGG